ncbi:transmembrane protein 231 [Aplysia californica]|uniref:Transmembrane protein 231 n=1 Tax=Aplysia californica TaxID=6500 RepID=A0ABM1AF64_APLCA|nr:transmembrane protein 231 [Aplysia californica]
MAIFEIFSHPELRRYKASVFSKATLMMLVILILTFIPPLLVVYRSYGFWLREATYREQPTVAFKKEFILILDLQSPDSTVAYSTFQQYNQLIQSQLRIPVTKVREEDVNGDGIFDRLNLDIQVPMTGADRVVGAKLLLFFYYKLRRFSQLHMEGVGYVEHSSPLPGASLDVFADLRMRQRQLLGHKGVDARYNTSLVDPTSPYASTYSLATIFRANSERNVTTILQDVQSVWSAGRPADSPFTISARVNYPEEVIVYSPGFWYLIKWGWVQYAAVLLLFLAVFNKVKVFVFQHQVVTTVVESSAAANDGRKDKFS